MIIVHAFDEKIITITLFFRVKGWMCMMIENSPSFYYSFITPFDAGRL